MNFTSNIINEKIQCRRYCSSLYYNGKFINKSYQDFEIIASVQPIGDEKIMEIEGERTRDEINIYTFSFLMKGDIIFYKNNRYEVHTVKSWISHCHAVAKRIDIE